MTPRISQLLPARRPNLWYPMRTLHMKYYVIVSLDPLLANFLESGNLAIKSLGKMYRLIVLVEGLSYSGWGLSGYNLVRYKCRSDRDKYVDRFLVLVYGKDMSGTADLLPEHLDDPRNTLSPGTC